MYSPHRYKSLLYEPSIRDHATRILRVLDSADTISEDKLIAQADFHISERPRIVREILKPLCKLSFVKKVRINTKHTPNQVYQLATAGHKHYKAILSGEWDIQTKFDLETALRYGHITDWPNGSDREAQVLDSLREIDLKLKNFPITTMRPALLLYILGGIITLGEHVTNSALRCLFASTVDAVSVTRVLPRRMVELGALGQRVDKDAIPEDAVYHGPKYPFYIPTSFGKEVYGRLLRYLKTAAATTPTTVATATPSSVETTTDPIEDLSLEELEILTRPDPESKPVRYTKSSPKKLGAFDGVLYLDWITRVREDKKILRCMEQHCQSDRVSEELEVLLEDIQMPTTSRDIWTRCVKTDRPYKEFLQTLKEYIDHTYAKTESTVMQNVTLPGIDAYIIDTSPARNKDLCKAVYAYLIKQPDTAVCLRDICAAVEGATDDCSTALEDLIRMNLIGTDITPDGTDDYAVSLRGAAKPGVRPMQYPHISVVMERMPTRLREQCKRYIDYIMDHPYCTAHDIKNVSADTIDTVIATTRLLATCGILSKAGGYGKVPNQYTVNGPGAALPPLSGNTLKVYEHFKTCGDYRQASDIMAECNVHQVQSSRICGILYYAGFLERSGSGSSIKYRIAESQKTITSPASTVETAQPDQPKNEVRETASEILTSFHGTPAETLHALLLNVLKTQPFVSLKRACQEITGSRKEKSSWILYNVARSAPDIVVTGSLYGTPADSELIAALNKTTVYLYYADTPGKKQVLVLLRDHGPLTVEQLAEMAQDTITSEKVDTAIEQLTQTMAILDAGDGKYKLAIGGQCDTNAGIPAPAEDTTKGSFAMEFHIRERMKQVLSENGPSTFAVLMENCDFPEEKITVAKKILEAEGHHFVVLNIDGTDWYYFIDDAITQRILLAIHEHGNTCQATKIPDCYTREYRAALKWLSSKNYIEIRTAGELVLIRPSDGKPMVPGIVKPLAELANAQMYHITGVISVSGAGHAVRLTNAMSIMQDLSLPKTMELKLSHNENETQLAIGCVDVSSEDIASFLEKINSRPCKVDVRITTVS